MIMIIVLASQFHVYFQPREGPNRGPLHDCENQLWNWWIVCTTNQDHRLHCNYYLKTPQLSFHSSDCWFFALLQRIELWWCLFIYCLLCPHNDLLAITMTDNVCLQITFLSGWFWISDLISQPLLDSILIHPTFRHWLLSLKGISVNDFYPLNANTAGHGEDKTLARQINAVDNISVEI